MSERIAWLSKRLNNVLLRHVRPLFVEGMKLTIIARYPGCDESDVIVTDDSIDELIALLKRRQEETK